MPTALSTRPSLGKKLALGTVVLIAVLASGSIFLAKRWPFTRERVAESLGRATLSKVKIGHLRETFFPHPGCIAEDVTVSRDGAPPLATIKKLTIEGSWTAVLTLTHRAKQVRAESLRLSIPTHVPPPVPVDSKRPETMIGELIADGTTIDIARDSGETLRFAFPLLVLNNVAKSKTILFRTSMRNAVPPGLIDAKGSFGPWVGTDPGSTRVSGSFHFTHADLSHFHGLAGLLSAEGDFKGGLGHVEVKGDADIPNFEVLTSQHAVEMRSGFDGVVNGLNGDTVLRLVNANWLHTAIDAHGTVKGKTLTLEMDSRQARIQDLLRLVIKSDGLPVTGPITFRAHAVLPPENEEFLRKIRLDGVFGVEDGKFTSPATQAKVNQLSERARKEKEEYGPESVVSDLKGRVSLRQGTATFSNLSFSVPGAIANMHGTYNVITHRIDLHGTLAMQASLSHAAGGIKSVLLKPLDPFFKKGDHGAVVPVEITGTYAHPSFRVSLTGKK